MQIIGGLGQKPPNATVALDGSGSTDVDGDNLQYNWVLVSSPEGSQSSISDSSVALPLFVGDLPGEYEISLIVNDGIVNSETDSVTVTVLADDKPVAVIEPIPPSPLLTFIDLDGSNSYDPGGGTLSYSWKLLTEDFDEENGGYFLDTDQPVARMFMLFAREVTVELTVSNGQETSAPSLLTIQFYSQAPTAVITMSNHDGAASVSGSLSDSYNGNGLIYSWRATQNGVVVTNDVFANPSLVEPGFKSTAMGLYGISLEVTDSVNNLSDSVSKDIILRQPSTNNLAPTVLITNDEGIPFESQTYPPGAYLEFYAQGDDVNGDPLLYEWELLEDPSLGATNISIARDRVIARDFAEGTYRLGVRATDGLLHSAQAIAEFYIEVPNQRPTANIEVVSSISDLDISVPITLDGSLSNDPDGDDLVFSWSLTEVPHNSGATLSDATAVAPTLMPDYIGTYRVQLEVTDENGSRSTLVEEILSISSAQNQPPFADISHDSALITERGEIISLDGSRSGDYEYDPITYQWSIVEEPEENSTILDDVTEVVAGFTPLASGQYRLQLVVSDGELTSAPQFADFVVLLPENQHNLSPTAIIDFVKPAQAELNAGDDLVLSIQGTTFPPDNSFYSIWNNDNLLSDESYTITPSHITAPDALVDGKNTITMWGADDQGYAVFYSGEIWTGNNELTVLLDHTLETIVSTTVRLDFMELDRSEVYQTVGDQALISNVISSPVTVYVVAELSSGEEAYGAAIVELPGETAVTISVHEIGANINTWIIR